MRDIGVRGMLVAVWLGCALVAGAAPKQGTDLAGLVIGRTHDGIMAAAKRLGRRTTPQQWFTDEKTGARHSRRRLEFSLDGDPGVRACALYFNRLGQLYGYDLALRDRAALARLMKRLETAGFRRQNTGERVGVVQEGPRLGAVLNISIRQDSSGRPILGARCPEVQRGEAATLDADGDGGKAGEGVPDQPPPKDDKHDAREAVERVL